MKKKKKTLALLGVHREAVLLIASSWSFDGGTHWYAPL
jgi:hypothetical protein